jgi:3-dehydroquinate dehydratase II
MRLSSDSKSQTRVSKTNKIILIQGANLNYLGKREPEIYGRTTAAELDATLVDYAKRRGIELEIFYTNLEGEAINKIYQCADQGFDGLVMNPAGFTYAGYALKDCVKGAGLPYIEIHISNVAKRNIHCVLSEIAIGVITGFGLYGYQLALDAMLHHLGETL